MSVFVLFYIYGDYVVVLHTPHFHKQRSKELSGKWKATGLWSEDWGKVNSMQENSWVLF